MKKYAYFPGCSLKTTGIEYELSTLKVAEKLGIELWEIPDWNCCGSSSAHLTNPYLALALPARNMAIAEDAGLDVAIPCAACYSHSKKSQIAAATDEKQKAIIEEIINRKYNGSNKALSVLEIFADQFSIDEIKDKVVQSLNGLKAVTYYGCLLVRPQELACDNVENPMKMDQILTALGVEVVEWNAKTDCCGASHSAAADSEMGLGMIDKIMLEAQRSGADCIVTACPMCLSNLDMRQKECAKKFNRTYHMPIYYFTELMGIAMGVSPKEMATDKHFVPAMELLDQIKRSEQ